MPLYQRPVSPFYLAADSYSLATNGTGPAVAGQVVLNAVTLPTTQTVTNMRVFFSGSPTGTCQLGIYDAAGSNGLPLHLLGNTATFTAATGVQTKPMTANLTLSPGQYWLAFLDTVADTVFGVGGSLSGMLSTVESTATGLTSLPSTMGTVTDFNVAMAFLALLLNGFS